MPVSQLAVVIIAQKKEKDSFIRPLSVRFKEKNLIGTAVTARQVSHCKSTLNRKRLEKNKSSGFSVTEGHYYVQIAQGIQKFSQI